MSPDDLAAAWLAAKAAEQAAQDRRIAIEQELIRLIPPRDEGSATHALGACHRVRLTARMSYKTDLAALQKITAAWPEDARPYRTKVVADETLLKAIRGDRPDLWRQIAPAVTVTPAKVNVVVEVVDGL